MNKLLWATTVKFYNGFGLKFGGLFIFIVDIFPAENYPHLIRYKNLTTPL